MKLVENKLLVNKLMDLVYHYPELDFWQLVETLKEKPIKEETPEPEITEEME